MFPRIINAIGFWALAGASCAMFFMAILMPRIQSYEQIRQTENEMNKAVQKLEDLEKRNAVEIEQLKLGDPILIARKVREQWGYRQASARSIPAPVRPVSVVSSEAEAGEEETAASLRAKLSNIGIQLPDTDLPEKLADPKFQLMMLFGSAASIILAFLLFGWWGGGRRRTGGLPRA